MNAFDTTRKTAVEIQRAYYARTSHRYNEMHAHEDDAHGFALWFMISVVEHLGIQSILDIGGGTGRALLKIKKEMPIKAEPDLFLIKGPQSEQLRLRRDGRSEQLVPKYQLSQEIQRFCT